MVRPSSLIQPVSSFALESSSESYAPDAEAAAKRFETFKNGDARPYVEDASFVRLREVSVVYNLPARYVSQLGPLKTLQLSLSGRNLLTFTSYRGLDPEVSNSDIQPIGLNYDVSNDAAPYRSNRSFWFSVTAGI